MLFTPLLHRLYTHRQHVKPASASDRPRYALYPSSLERPPNQLTSFYLLGKRIALPTRVEPKVYFANERTFLSWLNFAVIIGALAVGMLNFGDKAAKISAFLFTGVAVLTLLYALRTYHWRAKLIRVRGQAGFDDRIGPTILALLLLVAVIANFALRIAESSKHSSTGQQ